MMANDLHVHTYTFLNTSKVKAATSGIQSLCTDYVRLGAIIPQLRDTTTHLPKTRLDTRIRLLLIAGTSRNYFGQFALCAALLFYTSFFQISLVSVSRLSCRVPFDTYTITPQKHFLHWQDKEHNACVGIDKECRNSLQITTLQHDFSASSLSDLVTATKSVGCGGIGTKVRVRSGEGIIMLNSRCNLQITNTLRNLTCVCVCEYRCSRVWSLTVVNRGWGYAQKWL